MPEDMQLRPKSLDDRHEFLTSQVLVRGNHGVEYAEWRAARNKNVRIRGNPVPGLANCRTAINIERPIQKPRLRGRSTDAQSLDFNFGILEVHAGREERPGEMLPDAMESPAWIRMSPSGTRSPACFPCVSLMQTIFSTDIHSFSGGGLPQQPAPRSIVCKGRIRWLRPLRRQPV